jgi:hypothetical protein
MSEARHLSRRRFLKATALIAGASTAGVVLGRGWVDEWPASAKSFAYRALTNIDSENTPTGPLEEGVLRTLLATTETLVGTPVKTAHYETFFRWRSENLSGYRGLYERFAVVIDRAAKKAGKPDFASCDLEVRREILQSMTSRVYALVFERDWFRFEKHIFQQILTLFSETDAWILLGYESWPGTPRGLDSYTKAPRGAMMGKISPAI